MLDLSSIPRRCRTLLVGVDGRGGAGKSTFATTLGGTCVHMDDFVFEPWGWFDFERVRAQVLDPLLRDEPAVYQRYDWDARCLIEWHTVAPGGVVVVEGVAALDLRLRDAYDLRVWVDTPLAVCLSRGLERDGQAARPLWAAWSVKEERYAAEQRPRAAADVVVSGTRV